MRLFAPLGRCWCKSPRAARQSAWWVSFLGIMPGTAQHVTIATLRDNAPCVAESAPNKRRGLYRIPHLAIVTVYLVGQLAPLVASSVSCVSRPDRGVARALCSHSSAFARISLGVTKHPLIPRTKHDGLFPTVAGIRQFSV
jgi:hypothetical protein